MSSAPATTTTDWQPDEPPATPFWQRVPKFFLLPFDKAVATRILLIAAASVLSPLPMILGLGFLGFVLMGLVLLAMLVYGAQFGFTIIDRSSQGFLRPTDYPAVDENASATRPFKYVAINLIFAFAMGFVFALTQSQFLMWTLWLLLFVIAMPAVVMRLVMTGQVFASMSPAGDIVGA
jgi:hypothetical protein